MIAAVSFVTVGVVDDKMLALTRARSLIRSPNRRILVFLSRFFNQGSVIFFSIHIRPPIYLTFSIYFKYTHSNRYSMVIEETNKKKIPFVKFKRSFVVHGLVKRFGFLRVSSFVRSVRSIIRSVARKFVA